MGSLKSIPLTCTYNYLGPGSRKLSISSHLQGVQLGWLLQLRTWHWSALFFHPESPQRPPYQVPLIPTISFVYWHEGNIYPRDLQFTKYFLSTQSLGIFTGFFPHDPIDSRLRKLMASQIPYNAVLPLFKLSRNVCLVSNLILNFEEMNPLIIIIYINHNIITYFPHSVNKCYQAPEYLHFLHWGFWMDDHPLLAWWRRRKVWKKSEKKVSSVSFPELEIIVTRIWLIHKVSRSCTISS